MHAVVFVVDVSLRSYNKVSFKCCWWWWWCWWLLRIVLMTALSN